MMDNVEGAVAALFPADAQASPENDVPFGGGEVPTSPPLPQQKEPQEEYGGESPLCSPRKDASKLRRVIRSGGMVGEGRAVLPVGADKKDEGGERRRRRRRKRKVVINSTFCKYDCVRKAAAEHDWLEDPNEDGEKGEFNVFWTDTSVAIFRVMRLQNWQRINHFPSMHTIARKVHLANTLAKMRKPFPQHFAFCPRTWSLKSERSAFKKFVQSLPQKRTFIVKPSAGCQGKGIFLTQDPQDIAEDIEEAVVQEYISRPLLIEDKKFDLRVYVLVTSMKSPSIFLFDEGLVRLCTVDYQKPTEDNAHDLMMHLTNYAINKASENFIFNEDADSGDVGHKRDFAFLNKWLTAQGHDVERVWSRIEKVVVKTLLAAQPILSHVYTSCFPHNNDGYTCFEVLGFDLLLDQSLKPWLLEVNHSPSFSCHTPLDERIKTGVIAEVVRILNLKVDDRQRERDREKDEFKRRMAAQARRAAVKKGGGDDTELKELESQEMEAERRRQDEFVKRKQQEEDSLLVNFRRIYPCQDPSRQRLYEQFIDGAKEVNAPSSTVATVQREAECRKEREKQRERQEREEALRRGLHRPKSPSSKAGRNAPDKERGGDAGESGGGSGNAGRRGGGEEQQRPSRRTKAEEDAQRAEQWQMKLDQQMARHKRRISLGPRLSVFQLRDQYTTVQMVPVPEHSELPPPLLQEGVPSLQDGVGQQQPPLHPSGAPGGSNGPVCGEAYGTTATGDEHGEVLPAGTSATGATASYSMRLMDYPVGPHHQPDPPRQLPVRTLRDVGNTATITTVPYTGSVQCGSAAKFTPAPRAYRQVNID